MGLITVKDFAEKHGISEQAAYGRIKRGTLETKSINGVMMIDETPEQDKIKDNSKQTKLFKKLKKRYKRELKDKNKQIDRLQEQLALLQERYYNLTVMVYQQRQEQISSTVHEAKVMKTKKKKQKRNNRKQN